MRRRRRRKEDRSFVTLNNCNKVCYHCVGGRDVLSSAFSVGLMLGRVCCARVRACERVWMVSL